MIWLLLARWAGVALPAPVFQMSAALAVLMFVAGLVSSTLHLANRRNAWRALARWRTSWLSREGVFALAMFPSGALTVWGIAQGSSAIELIGGSLAIGLALATLYSTAMIYACLKTVPRWRSWHVRIGYPLFALASGGVLWLASAQAASVPPEAARWVVGLLLLASAGLKYAYWKQFAGSSGNLPERGEALRLNGRVRLLDAGHTGPTFLTHEFGYEIDAQRARSLKWFSLLIGFILPLILVLATPGVIVIAPLACLIGLLVERWLFFAEAQHVVRVFQ
jgi:DMSO reductase anchor subunit